MRALQFICTAPVAVGRCRRHQGLVTRVLKASAAAEASGQWVRLSPDSSAAAAAGGGGGSPPLLLDDAALAASAELQELARQQLELLSASLKLSLQAVLTSGITQMDSSIDEEAIRQLLIADSTCLHSTVYCRAPASLQTGQLQLQLVAASGGGSQSLHQQQQQQQRFLFLGSQGVPGSSLADQEQWILEQPVIVLPDSGGLVLPLAHNGFLVGLLVVERSIDPQQQAQQAEQAQQEQPNAATSVPPPSTCLLLRSAELQLLKQAAAVLALACAMDLRAALERVGAAYRQRQASALVQAAKKPLSVMRTLGTMLLPRLQPGEPDRDFAQGILDQGSRLQDVVSQLQAALHPSAAASVIPPALLQPGGRRGKRQRRALPRRGGSSNGSIDSSMRGGSSNGSIDSMGGGSSVSTDSTRGGNGGSIDTMRSSSSGNASGGSGGGNWQLEEPSPSRPALPSSSIGSDYRQGSTIEMDVDAEMLSITAAGSGSAPIDSLPGSTSSSDSNRSNRDIGGSRVSMSAGRRRSGMNCEIAGSRNGSRASADLLNVLMPLLASASTFAAVSGISFAIAEQGALEEHNSNDAGGEAASLEPCVEQSPGQSSQQQQQQQQQQQHLALPTAEVAVGPGSLKRMLSQLIDGVLACAAQGDLVQASVQLQPWEGRRGVAITLCCCYGLAHVGSGGDLEGSNSNSSSSSLSFDGDIAVAGLPRPPMQPEFAFLQSTASEAGGFFEAHSDATPDVLHLNSSALIARLWLPTAAS